jgi:predicted 3-demethylubiquinone-9 3-methyltransferase (glyoxalase superfamily)
MPDVIPHLFVPAVLAGMMKGPDRARAKRVAEAMLGMVKLDIAGLQKAYDGR